MGIVSIFSGTFCHDQDVVNSLHKKLRYPVLGDDLLDRAALQFKLPQDKLRRAVFGPPPLFGNFSRDRAVGVAHLRVYLADAIKADNLILAGYLSHLLPRNISHILRICLIANFESRIISVENTLGITSKEARKKIKKDDEECLQWTQYLFEKAPFDASLYDIIIPMHSTTTEAAVDIICENAQKPAVQTTPVSSSAVQDFQLAAQVALALTEKDTESEVTCSQRKITITINKSVTRLEAYKEELSKIARSVDGVEGVECKLGSKYHPPSLITNIEFEPPPKVLLVDDEKEFVHTLSERLLTRHLDSSVVYDGEQALSFIETEEPEVMVLDLKMPGIDGIEVLRRVKQDHPNVEVIILTGHGSEKEEELARELGAFAYLQKPINIDILAKTMKEAYRKINERRAIQNRSAQADDTVD